MSSDPTGKPSPNDPGAPAPQSVPQGGDPQPAAGAEAPSPGTQPAEDSAVERSHRELSFTRRALVQAGWVAPLIAALELPSEVYGASLGHVNIDHGNSGHTNTPHINL
jgi:hypothetical protein